jgi:hypothetical protein
MSEKISQMPSGSPAVGTDIFPIVRSSSNLQVPLSDLANVVLSASQNDNPAQGSDVITIKRSGTVGAVTAASIAGLSGGASFNTPGQGWFCGPGMMDLASLFITQNNAALTNFGANVVIVYQFSLTASWTLSSCSYTLSTASGGDNFNFGIYNSAKAVLIDAPFDGSISTPQTVSFTPVTLPPGIYYFAVSATSNSMQGPILFSSTSTTALNLKSINAGATKLAQAANATSANVLPSTLGTLTPITSVVSWQGFPLPIWNV